MLRQISDRFLALAPLMPARLRLKMARLAARRGLGVAALRAAPDDGEVQIDLGLYASAANSANPVTRLIGLAGLGRIEEAKALYPSVNPIHGRNRFRLASRLAPLDPAWALELLDAGRIEARVATLLALGYGDAARSLLKDAPFSRECCLLSAATSAAQGRWRVARSEVNQLFERDGLEAPLRTDDAPLSLTAFEAESPPMSSKDLPLISVVMAVRNGADTIETALRSLQRQSWSRLEIVVVDDGSTDDTRARVVALAERDGRIRMLENERMPGAYGARNTGIGVARGRMVAFHDADDWAHPRRLELQAMGLRRAAGSVASYFRITDDGRILNPRVFPLLRRNPILLMLRREVLDRIGPFEEVSLGGDSELLARLTARLGRHGVTKMAECLVVAQWRANSLMAAPDTGLSRAGLERRVAYTEQWRRKHAR